MDARTGNLDEHDARNIAPAPASACSTVGIADSMIMSFSNIC